jgi:hypothetical protein
MAGVFYTVFSAFLMIFPLRASSSEVQPPRDSGKTAGGDNDLPRIEKIGSATRLVVDGKPFLVLGGELHNSSSSHLDYMIPIWPKLRALNLNTVLAPVSWELLEPKEGQFDFSLVDGLIRGARENQLHLIFLWFGSWKNGVSSYAPGWVKTDLSRFPRVQDESGRNMDVLSAFSRQAREADARAFAAMLKHVRTIDGNDHTVLMVQVENEVGLLGPSRDHSVAAETARKQQVPTPLLSYLSAHQNILAPQLLQVWSKSGFRTSGTWVDVFGVSHAADEVFMAWQYAQYVDAVAAAGKAEYPLPMYVNAWLVQYDGQMAGQYPSGGPVPGVLDIWRAASSHLDLFSPDIYLPDFRAVCASYLRSGNALFIPEAGNQPALGSNALYALGQGALGFSPFAIEDLKPSDFLARTYNVIRQLLPLLLANVADRSSASVVQQGEDSSVVELGGYTLLIDYQKTGGSAPPASAIILYVDENEFVVAGEGLSIKFVPDSPGPRHAEILQVNEGTFVNERWVPGRILNGDETDGGTTVLLPADGPTIQKVRLFRHD